MTKVGELLSEERLTVKVLRQAGLSYPKIVEIVGCHYTTAMRIYSFEDTWSIEKKKRSGRPKKFDERGDRAMCRVARRLPIESLRTISHEISVSFPAKNPSAIFVRRILHKNGIRS